MNYYFIIYLSSVLLSIFGGISLFNKYKNPSGFFFLLFALSSSIWCVLYFLFLGGNLGPDITLIISRLAFAISLLGMYTFLLFIIFFDSRKKPIFTQKVVGILFIYSVIFIFSILTNNIIDSLYLGPDNVYRENFGIMYPIYVILYIAFIPLVLVFILKQLRKQNYINKLRLRYILYGVLVFIGSGLILQVILPLFGIWIFEKEIIFFFIFFICSVVYTVNRYYFNNIGYGIGKILIGFISIFISIFFTKILNSLIFLETNNGYWGPSDMCGFSNNITHIIFFILFYRLLSIYFLGKTQKIELKNSIQKLQENISFITNLEDLRNYLKVEVQKIFKTNYTEIILFENEFDKSEIKNFFQNGISEKIFINDIVFIEEKKTKFNKEIIKTELPENAFLIFPIYGKEGKNIGIFCLGRKAFGDFYNLDEINIIKKFIFFLEYHLKYLAKYKQIKDLSVNLDKKVDEKTIEYNNLINKQKEFISMISHEIRSPISSAVFHADSIIDDLENKDFTKDELKNELEILNTILIKIGDLSTKLFSVQYYDTNSINLYKEKIQINNLLQNEIEIYSHLNENIKFESNLDKKINFIEIDKIQFQQVIGNILTNAIKFIERENGIIRIETKKENGNFCLSIEDNGKGFEGICTEDLFDKYSKGSGSFTGLGMGLYLCKKIVEMHNGEIKAGISIKLGGAKIKIIIPLN